MNKPLSNLVPTLGLTVLATLFSNASLAAAIPVSSCGETLSVASGVYDLANDLTTCPSTAITITAKKIRFNLNGHTISGSNTGVGIDVQNINGVSIVNGSVTGFVTGINVNNTINTRISSVNVSNNSTYGIYLNASSRNIISGNTISGNGAKGLYLLNSHYNNLMGNNSSGNGVGLIVGGVLAYDDGINLNTSNNNTITGNIISNNKEDGLELKDSNNNFVYSNTANDNNRDGIYLRTKVAGATTTNNTVRYNNALHNGGSGIVVLAGATGNRLNSNISLNNNAIPSIDPAVTYADMSELNAKIADSCANTWITNTFDSTFDSSVDCIK
ncbi:MAG: right-handed parallel beta-helix repeat-containing protein [Methylococcaceae bacterium]